MPSPLAPMNAEITTIAKHCMMTWFTPTISVGRAAGIRTRQSICRLVHPAMTPASNTSSATPRSPRIVIFAIGGSAKRIVAIAPALWPSPTKTTIGIR